MWETAPKHLPWLRQILSEGGEDLASLVCGPAYWVSEPDSWFISVACRMDRPEPAFGIGIKLGLGWLAQQGAKSIQWEARSDWPLALAHMAELGFYLAQTNPESCLELEGFDPSEGLAKAGELKGKGVTFCDMEDYVAASPQGWKEQLFLYEKTVLADVPVPGDVVVLTMEQFESFHLLTQANRKTMWLALDSGVPIASSALMVNKVDPRIANTGLTGCLREHRRKGLATALKCLALDRAKTLGVKEVWTDNEENNPMFQLNVSLGFARRHDQLWHLWKAPSP